MSKTFNDRIGYGVVEPNHLSAPRNGQVYAQLVANTGIDILEQGMFVKYDYANNEVNFTGDGEWFLVYNEEKLYDERKQMHRDWAQLRNECYNDIMVPRVFRVQPGDIFTTNMLKATNGSTAITYNSGEYLVVGNDGVLCKGTANAGEHSFRIVKETTLPDMQNAVKIQVIA